MSQNSASSAAVKVTLAVGSKAGCKHGDSVGGSLEWTLEEVQVPSAVTAGSKTRNLTSDCRVMMSWGRRGVAEHQEQE